MPLPSMLFSGTQPYLALCGCNSLTSCYLAQLPDASHCGQKPFSKILIIMIHPNVRITSPVLVCPFHRWSTMSKVESKCRVLAADSYRCLDDLHMKNLEASKRDQQVRAIRYTVLYTDCHVNRLISYNHHRSNTTPTKPVNSISSSIEQWLQPSATRWHGDDQAVGSNKLVASSSTCIHCFWFVLCYQTKSRRTPQMMVDKHPCRKWIYPHLLCQIFSSPRHVSNDTSRASVHRFCSKNDKRIPTLTVDLRKLVVWRVPYRRE